jgi:hypothetical protein
MNEKAYFSFDRLSALPGGKFAMFVTSARSGAKAAYLDGLYLARGTRATFLRDVDFDFYAMTASSRKWINDITPRWQAVNVKAQVRDGFPVWRFSVMAPPEMEGGSLVKLAKFIKDLQAEIFATNMSAAEFAFEMIFNATGYEIAVTDENEIRIPVGAW